MPKMKTHRGAAKRFRLTAKGKGVRRRAMSSHLLEKKSAKRKRSFRHNAPVSGSNMPVVLRLLGKR